MSDVFPFLDRLAALAHAEGGWGYGPGQAAHLEPTCLGLLALTLEPASHREVFDKAQAALERCAVGDGTYRLEHGREEAVWPTALVLFVAERAGGEGRGQGTDGGCSVATARTSCRPTTTTAKIHDIDLTLVGWPWADGNFSWVEPTAWACLALRRAGLGRPSARAGRAAAAAGSHLRRGRHQLRQPPHSGQVVGTGAGANRPDAPRPSGTRPRAARAGVGPLSATRGRSGRRPRTPVLGAAGPVRSCRAAGGGGDTGPVGHAHCRRP